MKNVLIFNDISGLGNCSMNANLSVLSALKHYCMPVVTACYSCQTGFANFAVVKNPNVADFAQRIAANAVADAGYVGFCNDVATLKAVTKAVRDVLPQGAYLFVDPIMGDNGKLYPVFDDAYAEEMKRLVSVADCISPNLTEACILSGTDFSSLTSHKDEADYLDRCKDVFANFLQVTHAKSAVITGIVCADTVSNLVFDKNDVFTVTEKRVQIDFSGTGDAFSSAVLGLLLNGETLKNACTVSAKFVAQAARRTKRSNRLFGVDFCSATDVLLKK